MIIFMTLVQLAHQTVIYQFDAINANNNNNRDNWESSGSANFNNCGGIIFFGPTISQEYISRIFLDIEPHSHIIVDAEVISIDTIQIPKFVVDFQLTTPKSVIQQQSQFCDDVEIDYLQTISLIFKHNKRALWISIGFFSGGLIKLKLSIIKCQYECTGCIENYQNLCTSWKLHQYSFNQRFNINSEGWSSFQTTQAIWYCGGCNFINLLITQYSTILPPHQDILIRFYKLWQYIKVDYIYGKQYIGYGQFQVEILIKNHPDLLFKMKISSESSFSIRDFEIFYSLPENLFPNFIQGCLDQIGDLCMICQEGWIQDECQQNCHPICGDGIIEGYEQCDDENQISNDGCFQCTFSCTLFCIQCEFGKCLLCQSNYKLVDSICQEINKNNKDLEQLNEFQNQIRNLLDDGNCYHQFQQVQFVNQQTYHISNYNYLTYINFEQQFHIYKSKSIENCLHYQFDQCLECQSFYQLSQNKKYCIPKCNDGIVIENEICDDQNNVQFDGCYKCQLSCQVECNQCIHQQCYSCIDGWQIINYQCYQFCGDGQLAISSIEQCDDGNYQPYDGCFDCKLECNQNCILCSNTNTCFVCEDKFERNDKNVCIPICGDGIIIQGLEECEDLNDIPYDGCYQCLFQCVQHCSKCVQGICQECTEGYDLTITQCIEVIITDSDENDQNEVQIQKCGDGTQSNFEQCDDWNLDNADGCSSKCIIEENWNCNQEQPNLCFLQTKFTLKFLNLKYQHLFVSLQFSNEVKQISNINFTQSIISKIINLNQDQYQITINPVVNVNQTHFNMAIFEFDIEILESMTIQPNFSISFNSSLVDNNNMTVDLSSQSLLLKQPKVLSQNQINVANKFQQIGNALIIGLGAISMLIVLFGDLSQSFEIFDTLQFQSYLKFVNVSYPQNLQIYFQSSEIVTVTPILISLKITDILNSLINDNFIPSIGKLQEYQINADLLSNIYSQMSQITLIVFLYILLQFYPIIVYKYGFTFRFVYFIRQQNIQWLEKLALKLYQLNTKFIQMRNHFSIKGFRQLFYANCWDLLFKVLLYMASNTQSGYRSKISYLICFGVLSVTIIVLLLHFKGLNERLNVSKLRTEQLECINLLKKLLFILILIDLQKSDIKQCVMITVLIFAYIGILFMIQKYIEKIELIGIIWSEAPVMLFTLTSLIYCSDFQAYLTSNEQILVGFGQIGILILGLLGPVIKLGIKLYIGMKKQNPLTKVSRANIMTFEQQIQ